MTTTILRINKGECFGNSGFCDQRCANDVRTNIWLSTESEMFLLEGDLEIPTNRNANKCTAKPRSCLWPKSGGKVVVPYTISSKYSRLNLFVCLLSYVEVIFFKASFIRSTWPDETP